jgi:large subunit ribosomal protein L18
LKGIVDSGFNIPVSKPSLPGEDRVSGKHIAEYADLLKDNEEKYNSRFSALIKQGLRPEDYPKHFEEIRMKISDRLPHESERSNERSNPVNELNKEEFHNHSKTKLKRSSKGGSKKE